MKDLRNSFKVIYIWNTAESISNKNYMNKCEDNETYFCFNEGEKNNEWIYKYSGKYWNLKKLSPKHLIFETNIVKEIEILIAETFLCAFYWV